MTTRTIKRAPLNSIESLLLAQAVWEYGAAPTSWTPVAKILSKHPLLSRPKSFFTAQSCHVMYENLMKEADLEIHEDNRSPHAALNLQLAQKHYRSRYAELRELILVEETRFKVILKEIEDIRAGTWGQEVQERETSEQPPEPSIQNEVESIEQASEENLSGCDLTNATEPVDYTMQTNDAPDSHLTIADESSGRTTLVAEAPKEHQILNEIQPNTSFPTPQPGAKTDQPKTRDVEGDSELKEASVSSPSTGTEDNNRADATVEGLANNKNLVGEAVQIPDIRTRELTPDKGNIDLIDQRREEEEEETNEEEVKEEEEEASQGQEEVALDENLNEGLSSPKSAEQVDVWVESEPHTPVVETVASEPEPAAGEGHSSGSEEHVVTTRRSSRRRKSSAASVVPPQTRTRLRSQARLSESEPRVTADSENDDQVDIREDGLRIEEDRGSSPYDIGPTRRDKRKASFIDAADSPHEKKRMREDSEPAEEEDPGPSSHNTRARVTRHATRTEEQVALKRFQNVIGMLHSQISQHRNGNIFHNPIKNSEAPDYHEIVKRPMDLKTIKTRFKDGVIGNSLEYQRDIYLMFANAMMYNRPGSDVHAMAEDMMLESEGQIIAFRQTEGLVKRGHRP